ncbi:type II secretion system protein [Schlesneria paludicola]|nr:prepilin-type N-terminal cleavage/methylation domain-containing protein [Schlesneria paludicola]
MRRRGYSLIELLVVMAIIAVLLGFVLVMIQQTYAALRRLMELAG